MAAEVSDFSHRRSLATRCDIFHVHWPEWELNAFSDAIEAAARLKFKLFAIDLFRARGAKLVWTVHNLRAHEGLHPRLEKWFWSAFIRKVDGFIALTQSGRVAAVEHFPHLASVPGYVIPHGHYRDEYPNDSANNAREQLGISPHARVLVFFGQIREYKNVPSLIRAFREVHGNVVLCIAGKPNSDTLATELRREAAADPRVLLHLYDVPNERVQLFFHAADLVVLPYRDILNSGTALLSMSFNRPVLVPDRGAMEDLRERVGRQWIRTFVGEINALVLQQALAWATQASRPSEACLRELEWPKLADQTLRAYQDVIARRRQPRLRDSSNSRLLTASLAEQFHTERS